MIANIKDMEPRWHTDRERVVGVLLRCPTCGDLPGAISIYVPLGRVCRASGELAFRTLVFDEKVCCSQCGHYHEVSTC